MTHMIFLERWAQCVNLKACFSSRFILQEINQYCINKRKKSKNRDIQMKEKTKSGKKSSSSWLSADTTDLRRAPSLEQTNAREACGRRKQEKSGAGISRARHGSTQVQQNWQKNETPRKRNNETKVSKRGKVDSITVAKNDAFQKTQGQATRERKKNKTRSNRDCVEAHYSVTLSLLTSKKINIFFVFFSLRTALTGSIDTGRLRRSNSEPCSNCPVHFLFLMKEGPSYGEKV